MTGTAPPSGEARAAREVVRRASAVVILTGAGVSAESGVPTFRGPGGLWRNHRPEELATPQAFRRDPALVWEWYAWRRSKVAACTPNPAHRAIATFLGGHGRACLVTQNVDGLHERAGREAGLDPGANDPVQLHGTLARDRCSACSYSRPATTDDSGAGVPPCPECGALLRPDVVWFGESLAPEVLERAFTAASQADVCLVVGTSAVVHPAASVPLGTLRAGGALIEVNPQATPLSDAAVYALREPAGHALPFLLDVATSAGNA